MSRRGRFRYSRYWYKPAQPRDVKGGIKAQSVRGKFGQTWWGRRWTEAVEAQTNKNRISRGRHYARRGQVADLGIESGQATASVQGSGSKPYRARIMVNAYSDEERGRLARELSGRPVLVAKLLAGEMPEDIEELFERLGLPLFPWGRKDLVARCACLDWMMPCKHGAAVCFLLAEVFDQDPFLLFKLRGLEREDLLAMTSVSGTEPSGKRAKRRKSKSPGREPAKPRAGRGFSVRKAASNASVLSSEPLPPDPEEFWTSPPEVLFDPGAAVAPSLDAALPRRLGRFPLWRSHRDLADFLPPIYRTVSETSRD